MNWLDIETAPEGIVVKTKIHDENGSRNEQNLKRSGNLWFIPDGSMYVYYRPTHCAGMTILAISLYSLGPIGACASVQRDAPTGLREWVFILAWPATVVGATVLGLANFLRGRLLP